MASWPAAREAIAIAATRGGAESQQRRGVDFGAMAEPPAEEALNAQPEVAPADPEAPAAATEPAMAAEGERQIDA